MLAMICQGKKVKNKNKKNFLEVRPLESQSILL
jgi:hypothetical protein